MYLFLFIATCKEYFERELKGYKDLLSRDQDIAGLKQKMRYAQSVRLCATYPLNSKQCMIINEYLIFNIAMTAVQCMILYHIQYIQ